jgi:putative ABC transport system substrate-binding protein
VEETTMGYRTLGGIVTLILGLLIAPLATAAPPVRMARIGWLGVGVPPTNASGVSLWHFLERLRELGYVEGQNFTMEYRWAEGKPERLPDLAAELVQLPVDVLIAPSTLATRAAQQTTTMIPIVMLAGNPVGAGLVASLAHPGGNITGVSPMSSVGGKWLELLREAVPQVSRVTILWNPADQSNAVMWSEIQAGAHVVGVRLQSLEVRSAEQVEQACAALAPESADALIVFPSPLTTNHRQRIVETVAQHRLPAIYGYRDFVEAGGLMSYGVSFRELNRGMAVYVDKILKGAKPADLPVEQAMRFELVINLKTAEALGLTIPLMFLFQANEVIK